MAQNFEFSQLEPEAQAGYQAYLRERYDSLPPFMEHSPIWTPYQHSAQEDARLVGMQRALQTGLAALLEQAPQDERLVRLLRPRLGPSLRGQLAAFSGMPLDNQFLRPDYIYNNGQPQICEINSRFIFNGNIAGVEMAGYLAERGSIDTTNYQKLDTFMHETYDGVGDTVFVSDREPAHDRLLQMQRSGAHQSVGSGDIDQVVNNGAGRIVLELHQDELEPALPDLAVAMQAGVRVYNDPRVVHILHDKRLLVPLSDQGYMTSLVGPEVARVLADGVIPSYHPAWEGREPELAPGKVVLAKGAISGKSDDQLMVDKTKYMERFIDPAAYVYQHRHAQPKLTTPSGEQVEIAGTLPMTLTGEVFGAGIIRVVKYRRLRSFAGLGIAIRESV